MIRADKLGHEHATKAEDLLREAREYNISPRKTEEWLRRAQVHATLAVYYGGLGTRYLGT